MLLTAAACSKSDDAAERSTTSTSTSTTAAPTTATTPPATTTTAAPRPGECPPTPARNEPRPDRPKYILRIEVKPAENTVTGQVEVEFTPDLPTDRLVFRLWANSPRTAKAGARESVTGVVVGAHPVTPQQPDATTLVVPLSPGLSAGQKVGAVVDFTLALPGPVSDRISRSGDSVRLGSFFPILSWEPGVGWATEPATSGFAEASTAQTADFTASIGVPPGLDVLATGVPDGSGRWRAEAVEDFAVSVGRFKLASAQAGSTKVTVGVDPALSDDPNAYLRRVVDSINDFSTRFGPYPWPAYTLAVQPVLRGGIEYPMHVMQGPRTVGRTTPHEVGHQWFYGLVENNQGRDPWLDEGLASWAEARGENVLASFTSRAIPVAGKGRMAEPMTFWESRQSAYYRSIYVQPVQALAALGPPELVDCALRLYVSRMAYRVARPKDLLDALSVVFPEARAVFARYGVKA